MTKGRVTCEFLKQIRADIAKANQIDYAPEVCSFKGECEGTCPKCEQELHFLEHQLNKKQGYPKTALLVGVTLSILSGFTSCNNELKKEQQNKIPISLKDTTQITNQIDSSKIRVKSDKIEVKSEPKILDQKSTIASSNQIVTSENNDSIIIQNVDTNAAVSVFTNLEFYPNYSNFNDYQLSGVCPITNVIPIGTNISFLNSSTQNLNCNPSFNNKNETIETYLNKHFKYPKNKLLEKTSFNLQLFIDKHGKIQYIYVLESLEPEIDRLIIDVFTNMPEWNPKRDSYGNSIESQVKLNLIVSTKGIIVKNIIN